ncbi:MAG: hypothetical protein EBV16_13240 [Betaproteobacteria bacterium]|nr:hypothetical protein [Betaproteobacteria bacterium]
MRPHLSAVYLLRIKSDYLGAYLRFFIVTGIVMSAERGDYGALFQRCQIDCKACTVSAGKAGWLA